MTSITGEPNWEGLPGATEHRTAGVRAWCYQDNEWCYSDALCRCCDTLVLPDRWKGMYGAAILADLIDAVQGRAELMADEADKADRFMRRNEANMYRSREDAYRIVVGLMRGEIS